MRTALLVLLLLFNAACIPLTDYENTQEDSRDALLYLDENHQAQQTLILRRLPVESVILWMAHPAEGAPPATSLTLTLEGRDGRGPQRVSQTYGLPSLAAPRASPFPLPPTDFLPNRPVTLTLEVNGGGLWLYGRSEEAYPPGALTLDGAPQPGDLAFRLTYDYGPAALLSDACALLPRLWLLLPLAALLLLPGAVVSRQASAVSTPHLAPRTSHITSPSPHLLLIPLSAAFWPLLLAWTTLLHIPWTRPRLLLLALLLILFIILRARYAARGSQGSGDSGQEAVVGRQHPAPRTSHVARRTPPFHHLLIPISLFLLVLASRLIMARDLAAPPWVDSVHHALITRLIVAEGTYPATYAPYGETANAHYHSGYHALLAAFTLLSGLEIPDAMLLLGQVLNALVSTLGVYLFTRALGFPRRAGLLAALIAGLFTPMPAYYLSWGRYTQLAGLLLLPAAFALWTADDGRWTMDDGLPSTVHRFPSTVYCLPSTVHSPRSTVYRPPSTVHPAPRTSHPLSHFALLLAALLITHYRVTAFLLILLAAWEIPRLGRKTLPRLVPRLGALALGALLAAPWLWPALTGFIAPKSGPGNPARAAWFSDFAWRYLTAGLGKYTLGLALLGLGWALWKHRHAAATLLLWVSGMFLLANLGALGLPGGTWVNNTSVEIALFLPIAALGGLFLDALLRAWERALSLPSPDGRGAGGEGKGQKIYRLLLAALLLAAVFQGLRATLTILNPATILFHEADRAAMRWMDANLPPEAAVVINPAAWGYGLYVGADGGYWISPLTGRRTLPPTLLYGWGTGEEIRHYNAVGKALLEAAADPAALAAVMEENGAAYAYIGARGGPLSARAMRESGLFQTLYHQGDTWVFRLKTLSAP